MYQVSDNYKNKIYNANTRHLLRIYINGNEIDKKFILDYKISQKFFPKDEFSLGVTPSLSIDLKLHKNAIVDNIKDIYIISGIEDEEVPIGYFNVDSVRKEDDFTVSLKLLDNMIKFEFNYDGSQLINKNGKATLIEVLNDICLKAEVELGSTSFLNQDNEIAVYDNTISARTYLSYISEQAGGFACIGRDGKLYIKSMLTSAVAEIPIQYFKNTTWGEKFQISRIKYEDGIQNFESGNTEDNTVYINQDNMFIVNQEQIDNIYSQLNGLNIYSFEGYSITDPALDVGDIITIDGKNVIYQGNGSFSGKLKMNISSNIQLKSKEETTVRTPSQKTINRRVQSKINQLTGEIETLIKEIYEEEGIINENYTQILQNISNIINSVQNSGGCNLIKNSVMFAFDEKGIPSDWEIDGDGILEINSSSEAYNNGSASGHVFILNNKIVKQNINVKADSDNILKNEKTYYTFSTKIKKDLIGYCYVKIYNDNEEYIIELNEGEECFYREFEVKALLPKNSYYTIEFYGSEGSNATFTDNMLSVGTYKSQWSQANGEIMNTQVNVNINGVLVKSSIYQGDYTIMSPLEFAGYSNINGIITKVFSLNKDTTIVKKLKSEDEIAMMPIKVVSVTEGELQGWAFVPST